MSCPGNQGLSLGSHLGQMRPGTGNPSIFIFFLGRNQRLVQGQRPRNPVQLLEPSMVSGPLYGLFLLPKMLVPQNLAWKQLVVWVDIA